MSKDRVFYKYYSLAPESIKYTLAALEGNYVWAAKPAEFSDPHDNPYTLSRHFGHNLFKEHNKLVTPEGIEAVYRELQENRSTLTLPDRMDEPSWKRYSILYDSFVCEFCDLCSGKRGPVKDLFRELSKYLESAIGICCFTTDCENPFMWDKYASGYSGFCAEYKFVETPPVPVKYKESRLKLDFYETLRNPDILWDSFFVKLPHYKEEKEYRVLYFTDKSVKFFDPDNKDHRKFRGAQMTSLFFGHKTPPELVRVCCQLAPDHVGFGRFNVEGTWAKARISGFACGGVPLTAKDYKDDKKLMENHDKERLAVVPQYKKKHQSIPESISRLISNVSSG